MSGGRVWIGLRVPRAGQGKCLGMLLDALQFGNVTVGMGKHAGSSKQEKKGSVCKRLAHYCLRETEVDEIFLRLELLVLQFITYYSRTAQIHATDMGPNTISCTSLDRNANLRDVVFNKMWCYVDREQLGWIQMHR